nr:hypothetical protein [Tanacetum cinerariifolium]
MYGRAYSTDLIPGHVSLNSKGSRLVFVFITYQGISELVEDTKDEILDLDTKGEGLEDRGPGILDAAIEIAQMDGTVYTYIQIDVLPVRMPVQTSALLEWSSGSLPVSPSSQVVPSLVASLVTTIVDTITVHKDEFLEVGAQLELHRSMLHDHTLRLDALPHVLFDSYDRDLRELYTKSREVRNEIFSQIYKLRSLKQEHERATVTFGAI